MIDYYISDFALQALSQLLVLVTYLSVTYIYMDRKKVFLFSGILFAVISTVLIYHIYENIFLTILFCIIMLLANGFKNTTWIVSLTIGYLLVDHVSLIYPADQETLFYMMLKLASLECAYFIYRLFRYFRQEDRNKIHLFFQSVIFSFCIVANGLMIAYHLNMQFGTRRILFFPVFANTVLYLVTSALIHGFVKTQKIQERLKIQQMKNEMIEKQYSVLKEKYEDVFLLKHDMKHHLQTLSILLHQGNEINAEEYIEKVSKDINRNSLIFTSTNQMLEIVLNEKYLEAKRLGIDMEMNCIDVPLDFISDVDIIVIFANILDNAVEAASTSNQEKKITVSLAEKHYYIVFEVINTYGNKLQIKDHSLQSTKEGHLGLGITSVNKTVKRYGGIVKKDYDGNIFKMVIFLPVKSDILNNI